MQTAIFGPFFATMFLTLVVWVYMYARRISFISANKISPNDLAAPGSQYIYTTPLCRQSMNVFRPAEKALAV